MTAPFSCPIRPENVGELIDLTVPDKSSTVSMAELQLEGVAALYNILCEHPVAYLADEVGMGKTYQALALAAVLWNERPDARILFISPRQNLQQKWLHEYDRFFASNYRRQQGIGDDRVSSLLFGRPIHRPMGFDNLRGWIPTIGMPEPVAPFLRHTSFTRPVFLSSRDFDDMDELWETTEARFRGWGLFGVRRPRRLDAQNASRELNCAFATALNAKLEAEAGGRPYFDLVVVDEAQCLRNPENQTNLVLSQVLRRQVGRWLFMSATPAHGGPADLPTTLNHYPGRGTLIEPGLAEDLPALQHALQPLMIRRQRQYLTRNEAKVGKQQYRKHDKEQWAVRDDAMSVLGTLSMGLMQKGLVDVLQGRSNRFRIGFLSSFESLQSSLQGSTTTSERLADETHDDAGLDWHRDQTSGVEPNDAPDASFVQAIDADFRRAFGRPLPHPKIDAVVDRVARAAFGTDQCLGGRKFLIFTRRVSTVDTLRDRLTRRYLESVAARIRRCWDPEFAWDTIDADDNPLRRAMADQGWLNRYRETFRASGRNATFFEDGWLLRLCRAGGVSPEAASQNISERLWAESWTHASRSAGERRQQHRADRIRYLALHAVRREPQAFGLTPDSAKPWRVAYEAALHEHFEQAPPDPDPHVAPELFEGTFWTAWDDHFAGQSLALPAREPASADDLHQRQVVRTLLAQTFRLTDTLLDLYYAEEDAQQNAGAFATRFLEWLSSNDPSASRLREECAEWLQHLSLIVESSLDGAGKPWAELARRETWPELFNLAPVVGVTGGSGAHQSATRQFRTPSLPRVIVCTDTLKEGVDLHLFCDQVLHYGVAWTSGDLEQRVGRVDRYFSRIERRLAIEGPPPEVELHVGYPHVLSSLERGQVDRVIERQREAERLMDSPLAGTRDEDRELFVDGSAPVRHQAILEPYRMHEFPRRGRSVVAVPSEDAKREAEHYHRWFRQLTSDLREDGWEITPSSDTPVSVATLHREDRQHDLTWSFDAALRRYVLTLTSPPWSEDEGFCGGRRRRVAERTSKDERYIQLLVPTPAEETDSGLRPLRRALQGAVPHADHDARAIWEETLRALTGDTLSWSTDHEAQGIVRRGIRDQRLLLRFVKHGVHAVSTIARLGDLERRDSWYGHSEPPSIARWAMEQNAKLDLGSLAIHPHHGLIFVVHLLLEDVAADARKALLEQVAWRADLWEASLTGVDRQ